MMAVTWSVCACVCVCCFFRMVSGVYVRGYIPHGKRAARLSQNAQTDSSSAPVLAMNTTTTVNRNIRTVCTLKFNRNGSCIYGESGSE